MEVILKNVRLSYPDLFTPGNPPKDSKPGTVGKYGCQAIFAPDSEAAKTAQDAFMKAAQETFGQNWRAILEAMERSKKCLRTGDSNLDASGNVRNGYAGNLYIVARNKAKPVVIDSAKVGGQWVHLTESDGKPYGGCYVNLKVDIYAMKAKGTIPNSVNATLKAVQFVRDGEAFGAGPGNADGFEDLGGGEEATAGAAGLF